MLKLSRKADYGLIALRHLAVCHERGAASAKEIAGRYRIPQPLLSKVLQKLARSGFLAAEQGVRGGYRLARDPHRISALEVIRAIDGPVRLTSCLGGLCDHTDRCTVREPLRRVHEGILNLLAGITITDMAEMPGAANSGERHPGRRLYRPGTPIQLAARPEGEKVQCSE
jgi:Rrf2 family protein